MRIPGNIGSCEMAPAQHSAAQQVQRGLDILGTREIRDSVQSVEMQHAVLSADIRVILPPALGTSFLTEPGPETRGLQASSRTGGGFPAAQHGPRVLCGHCAGEGWGGAGGDRCAGGGPFLCSTADSGGSCEEGICRYS